MVCCRELISRVWEADDFEADANVNKITSLKVNFFIARPCETSLNILI